MHVVDPVRGSMKNSSSTQGSSSATTSIRNERASASSNRQSSENESASASSNRYSNPKKDLIGYLNTKSEVNYSVKFLYLIVTNTVHSLLERADHSQRRNSHPSIRGGEQKGRARYTTIENRSRE